LSGATRKSGVSDSPAYRGDPACSSLWFDVDVAPEKPTTDVVVLGTAYAPGGRPVKELPVGLRIGNLAKDLLVRGTRVYPKGMTGVTSSAPAPFVSRPIVCEEAFGGGALSDPQAGGAGAGAGAGDGAAAGAEEEHGGEPEAEPGGAPDAI